MEYTAQDYADFLITQHDGNIESALAHTKASDVQAHGKAFLEEVRTLIYKEDDKGSVKDKEAAKPASTKTTTRK